MDGADESSCKEMLGEFSKIQGLVFDMDGVLFLSTDCHEQAFRETLLEVGIEDLTYATIAGMRTDEAFRKIFSDREKVLSEDALKNLVAKKRERALGLLMEKGQIAPGSSELISRLRQKYRLALASSASPQTVALFLEKSGYADAFEVILDGSFVQRAKPDPEIYQQALVRLRLTPEQALVIEDAESGVRAAQSAGMSVIAVLGNNAKETFLQVKPTMVVSSLIDIGPILLS